MSGIIFVLLDPFCKPLEGPDSEMCLEAWVSKLEWMKEHCPTSVTRNPRIQAESTCPEGGKIKAITGSHDEYH